MPALARTTVFEQDLTSQGIPFDGLSFSGSPPYNAATVTISFKPEATQEQKDWANNYKDTEFDWRPRQFLSTGTIVNLIGNLTAQQQQTFYRWVVANWVKDNEQKVIEALTNLGFPLPYDEVAP